MKTKLFIIISCITFLYLTSCAKRNYFPDPDDPGLSLLTAHGFNIGTFYLNNVPYINPFLGAARGNSMATLRKIVTNSPLDTLMLSWDIGINDNGSADFNSPYQTILLLMPIPKSFTKTDFIAMSGQQFIYNSNTLQTPYFYDELSVVPNIYFVKINSIQTTDSTANLELSGLFNCNIPPNILGDSIVITKGRFDFEIDESSLNF